MPAPTVNSPNVGNLQVGKGIVSFKKTGDSVFRDLGSVTSLILTPNLTTLEHFSRREGVKKKDLVVVLEKTCTAKMIMEEFTALNLAIMVLGNSDAFAVGGPEVDIFLTTQVTGELKFVGTNDVGPKMTVDLYNVSFTPSGDLQLISDEWNNMEVTADVLVVEGTPGVAATATYTATVPFTTADTLVIGGKTYTLQDTLTAGDGHVKNNASLATALANLVKAINLTGVSGTDYGAGTVADANFTATSDATHLVLTAKVPGVAGNALGTTDTSSSGAFGAATAAGGVDPSVPNAGKFGLIKFTNV